MPGSQYAHASGGPNAPRRQAHVAVGPSIATNRSAVRTRDSHRLHSGSTAQLTSAMASRTIGSASPTGDTAGLASSKTNRALAATTLLSSARPR